MNDTDKLAACEAKAVVIARAEWQQHIIDPPFTNVVARRKTWTVELDAINRYIGGVNPSKDPKRLQGLGWWWDAAYLGNHHGREWCGAFTAYALGGAGLKWKPHRYTFFSSTDRLLAFGLYRDWVAEGGIAVPNSPVPGRPRRVCAMLGMGETAESLARRGIAPRRGNVLLVGDGLPPRKQGTHITLVEDFDPHTGAFFTFEGNGGGEFPDGKRGEGVVRGVRFLRSTTHSHGACTLIQLVADDFEMPI